MEPGTPREHAQSEKMRRWHEIEEEVARIGDALGKGIDKGIRQAVVSLMVHGFHTDGSCEGHTDHGVPFPWVDVVSEFAQRLSDNSDYRKLSERTRARKIGAEERRELENLIERQKEENEKEYKRLLSLLDEFYNMSPEPTISSRLAIEKGPWNQSRIQPDVVALQEGSGEAGQSVSQDMKVRQLTFYRQEIERFALFLKNKFLNS
ncbi:MAG: hypothetical protein Q7S48_03720 [bacterium]|nr:hypothetical protein [bacterium]